jgi:hypothetical protein
MSPSIGAFVVSRRFEYRHFPRFAWHFGQAANACRDVSLFFIASLASRLTDDWKERLP